MNVILSAILFGISGALLFLARRVFGADTLTGEALTATIEAAKGVLRLKLRGYCAEAEKTLGGGTGQWKLAVVLDEVTDSAWYNALPDEVKRELDASALVGLIDKTVVEWLTPQLESNPNVQALIGSF